ncbi:hypothetical protein BOO91_20955 [Vibrio navarrensis]|nr:hypothetical protein [Vibrio navarrensis]
MQKSGELYAAKVLIKSEALLAADSTLRLNEQTCNCQQIRMDEYFITQNKFITACSVNAKPINITAN